jgi:hypothetical protein
MGKFSIVIVSGILNDLSYCDNSAVCVCEIVQYVCVCVYKIHVYI